MKRSISFMLWVALAITAKPQTPEQAVPIVAEKDMPKIMYVSYNGGTLVTVHVFRESVEMVSLNVSYAVKGGGWLQFIGSREIVGLVQALPGAAIRGATMFFPEIPVQFISGFRLDQYGGLGSPAAYTVVAPPPNTPCPGGDFSTMCLMPVAPSISGSIGGAGGMQRTTAAYVALNDYAWTDMDRGAFFTVFTRSASTHGVRLTVYHKGVPANGIFDLTFAVEPKPDTTVWGLAYQGLAWAYRSGTKSSDVTAVLVQEAAVAFPSLVYWAAKPYQIVSDTSPIWQ